VEGSEDNDDVIVVEVRKAVKPVEFVIKKEILEGDDEDEDAFYGFSTEDIPRPIIIKVSYGTFTNFPVFSGLWGMVIFILYGTNTFFDFYFS
jgi:hypothetical protein